MLRYPTLLRALTAMLLAALLCCTALAEDIAPIDLAAQTAQTLAERFFTADAGLTELYGMLVQQRGAFRRWDPRDQYYFARLLPDLQQYEAARLATFHPDWLADQAIWDELLVWDYALPDEDAIGRARAFAVDYAVSHYGFAPAADPDVIIQCGAYLGERFSGAFPQPLWCFRFLSAGERCEVWFTADEETVARASAEDVARVAKEAYRASSPVLCGNPVTEEQLACFSACAIFRPETAAWHYVLSAGQDVYWIVTVSDEDLSVLSVEAFAG